MTQIKTGDLVMVVRGRHCCNTEASAKWFGYIFRVAGLEDVSDRRCKDCGDQRPMITALRASDPIGWDVNRLKRIPPLSELEGERTQEDIREPA